MKKEDQDQVQVQDQDQVQVHFPLSTISYDHTSNLQNSQYDQQGAIQFHTEQLSQQINHQSIGGSSSVQLLFNSTELAVDSTREERTDAAALPAKWMSSKMRLMRKMMGEDRIVDIGKQGSRRAPQDQALHYSNPDQCCSISSNSNGIIRVCSNCSTTKTPLWRSGPQGPKSLCNACGIRQMKARRAMRAAAAAASAAASGGGGGGGGGGGVLVPATAPKKAAAKEERSLELVDRTVPFKKRFKNIATSSSTSSSSAQKKKKKKLRFDDVTISLSKKLSFNQTSSTFPQEEKDAAILLMALSCGLIHG